MTKTLGARYVEDPVHMRLFQQERAIYEVTELMEFVMAEQGITRSQLAAKLGQSRGWVTQLLDGQKNKTIRTVADVFAVLGREYRSTQRPIQVGSGEVSAEVSFPPQMPEDGPRTFQVYDPNRKAASSTKSSVASAELQVRAAT